MRRMTENENILRIFTYNDDKHGFLTQHLYSSVLLAAQLQYREQSIGFF